MTSRRPSPAQARKAAGWRVQAGLFLALALLSLASCDQLLSMIPSATTTTTTVPGTTTTTVLQDGAGGFTVSGPPRHSVALQVSGAAAGASPRPYASGMVTATLDPSPMASGVTYSWFMDGEAARTNSGELAPDASSLALGLAGSEVSVSEGAHTIMAKATLRGYSFTASATITTAAPNPRPAARKMTVLMYHHVVDRPATGQYERSVTDFENDLVYLRDHGFSVISLEDMLEIQSGRASAPSGKLVVLTFDDGYRDMYEKAYPVLKQYGMKATFFIITDRVGGSDPPYATWAQWREMARYRTPSGTRLFTMGSHTRSHPFLHTGWPERFAGRGAYLAFLDDQIGGSKSAIQGNIPAVDRDSLFISLPYGDGVGNTDIMNVARRHGFKAIRNSDPFPYDINSDTNHRIPSIEIANTTAISSIETHY